MPIKRWEVYDAEETPEDAVSVTEWDAEDAAKSAAQKLDHLEGEWQSERTMMVREEGSEGAWKRFEVTAECDVTYSASECEDEPTLPAEQPRSEGGSGGQ